MTALVEACLLADLTDAYPAVLAALDTRAALDADINHLMARDPGAGAHAALRRRAAGPTWPASPR